MYIFKATYVDYDSCEERRSNAMEIEDTLFGNEKEIYLQAMGLAYDLAGTTEYLESVEFIAG